MWQATIGLHLNTKSCTVSSSCKLTQNSLTHSLFASIGHQLQMTHELQNWKFNSQLNVHQQFKTLLQKLECPSLKTAWKCTHAQASVQFVHSMCTNLDTPCTLKLLLGHPLYTGAVYMLAHRLGHMCTFPSSFQAGQVENAEVRKPKYGSEKKSRLSVSSALLTHDCSLIGKR